MNIVYCMVTLTVVIYRIGEEYGFEEEQLPVAIKYLKNQGYIYLVVIYFNAIYVLISFRKFNAFRFTGFARLLFFGLTMAMRYVCSCDFHRI